MKYLTAAERVLEQFQIRKHPVPVEQIAGKLGATVVFEDFDSRDHLSGVLFKENGNIIIAVNSADPPTRQRFTIAHECGHLVLKHKGDIFVDQAIRLQRDELSALAVDPLEIEANGFAAELLMPRSWVLKEYEKRLKATPVKAETVIRELARAFHVSPKAMEYRLANLGLIYPDH
jgi:Zn-dependent peptidase ImmA (M78 family)